MAADSGSDNFDKAKRAFELRRMGLEYREIAQQLGMSVAEAYNAVQDARPLTSIDPPPVKGE